MILNRIIGDIVPEGQTPHKHAFISAAQKASKHPSKRVTNAFIRRGARVLATCGVDHCLRSPDVPTRPDWGPATPLDFMSSFEEE